MNDELTNRQKAAEGLNEAGRRLILMILAEEETKTLSEYLIELQLRARWLTRSREWLRVQLTELEKLGAVTVIEPAGEMIVRLTPQGQEHVDGIKRIPGVRWVPIGL